jgi:hypothetical protein
MEVELSDSEAGNATLKGYYLQQGVEIVIGGVPTVVKIRFMFLFMSVGRVLLQRSVSTNLFDLVRHQADLLKVEVGI